MHKRDRFFKLSLDLLCIIGDGHLVHVNPAFERVLGYSIPELLAIPLLDLLHPDDVAATRAAIVRLMHEEANVTGFENRYRCKDGSYRWLLWTAEYDPADDRIYGAARDITDRKLTEERLRRSEARFRVMSDASPLGISFSDAEGRVWYANRACEEMTGLPSAQLVGRSWGEAIHQLDRARVVGAWEAAAAAGVPFRQRYRLLRPAGDVRWVRVQAAPLLEEGVITGYVGQTEDITDQVELEQARAEATEELGRAKDAAEAASNAKSEFLANMSHEIRTPMTAILGFADLLGEPGLPPEEVRGHVETIRRNGQHLLAIINDILDLSKIEAGQMSIERIELSPAQVLGQAMELMAAQARAQGLDLRVVYDSLVPVTIRSDPTRLRQVLVNLIGNAIKFTARGRIRVSARLLDVAGEARLSFAVSDSGIGMTREQLGRLFQPFTQADASTTRRFGGSGLGLTISRHLAKLLGGDITVQSQAGVGTTFCLEIATGPLEGVPLLEVAGEVSRPPLAKAAARRVTLAGRILLAEDGRDNQLLIGSILRRAGAEVTIADNGRAALKEAMAALGAGRPYGLILMDMHMPELDGYGATEALRREGYSGPIVALTASAMETDRQHCLDAGCDDFLSKPVGQAVLVSMVSRHLSPPSKASP